MIDFGIIYSDLLNDDQDKNTYYNFHDGFLFMGAKLCLPTTSIREHVARDLHSGGCSGHLGRDKDLALGDDCYYWPRMKIDANNICE